MTLGEKLKQVRNQFGLSQEQLAEKLFVSRAAIAKWETDGGIPDMENLKLISKTLQVSIDYLVDDSTNADKFVIKEAINLDDFGKGQKKTKCDKAIRAKYPDAVINFLVPKQKLTKGEKILDNALGLTLGFFNIPQIVNSIKIAGYFYLITKNDNQLLSLVTTDAIETRAITQKVTSKKFELNNITFTVGYAIK